jgi:hypothetical protein
MEKWLPVKGYESFYEVSSFGRVRSLPTTRSHGGYRPRKWLGKMLSIKLNPRKYCKLALWGNGVKREVRLHVLVAEHFVPNPFNLSMVCHKDDDRTNNKASNLYWGTAKSNMTDKAKNNRAAKKLTSKIVTAIKTELKSLPKGKRQVGNGRFCEELAIRYGVSRAIIYSIRRGELWGHVNGLD